MKRFKKLIMEWDRKINKKKLAITFGTVLILTFLFTPSVFAADKPNIGERILSGMISAMADGLNAILSGFGSPIDKLVFNKGNEKTMGLTLLANNKLSNYIFGVYQVILWIAASAYVPMGLVVAIDFKRSSDNASHKAVLKQRLIRFVLTFILLTSMPMLIDMIFAGNNVLVNVFGELGRNSLSGSGVNVDKGFLVEAFQQKASTSGSLLDACIYMMSVVLNGWLIFYYMLRDITISFLFLLFPITAIFYPFAKGKVVGWFKEICSNIYSQAIQAVILSIVLGMCATMSNFGETDPTKMYDSVFALVVFASIIPMTGILKRMVGLEGNVGAAASMAGVGAFMGAIALAKGATSSVKQGVGNIKEGRASLKDLNAQESKLNKNASFQSSVDGKELSPVHAQSELTLEQIQGKKAEARRQIAQGIGNLGGSAWVGSSFAVGGGVFGARGVAAGAAGGIIAGGNIGDKVGEMSYNAGASASGKAQDIAFGVGVRPDLNGLREGNEQIFKGGVANSIATGNFKDDLNNSVSTIKGNISNMKDNIDGNYIKTKALRDTQRIRTQEDKELIANRYTGVDNEIYDKDPVFQKNEQVAMLAKKRYESLGQHDKAFRAYAKYTPTRKSPQELEKIEGLMMYRDKDMSIAYTDKRNEEGKLMGREVHWTGTGDPNIVYPQVEPITFNNGSTDLTSNRVREIYTGSEEYADKVAPITLTPGQAGYSEQMKLNKQIQQQYYNQSMKAEQERIVNVRAELGSSRAYVPTAPQAYTPITSVDNNSMQHSINKVQELDSISKQLMEEASRLSTTHGQIVKDPNLYVSNSI